MVVGYGQNSRLLVSKGMTGATGNIYVGLHEFREMAFFLHACRKADHFVDIGSNVGSFSVLIGNEIGTEITAIEPIPATFDSLVANLKLNGIDVSKVFNMGLGSEKGTLRFTDDLDTVNHVLKEGGQGGVEIEVNTLDNMVETCLPTFLKIDVEGFEMHVIKGGKNTLESAMALMVELNGSGEAFGFTDDSIRRELKSCGYVEVDYDPFQRVMRRGTIKADNALFVREPVWDELEMRLKEAPQLSVRGVKF